MGETQRAEIDGWREVEGRVWAVSGELAVPFLIILHSLYKEVKVQWVDSGIVRGRWGCYEAVRGCLWDWLECSNHWAAICGQSLPLCPCVYAHVCVSMHVLNCICLIHIWMFSLYFLVKGGRTYF